MAFLNYESKRGSGKKLKVHFDLPEDDDYPNHKHSSSSVSSECSLDSDDTDNDNSIDNVDSKYGSYGSPVWSFQGGSVTQSPPVQFLSSPEYDPNRIPSSIFNKPTSPMEWSVASNESVFSIHLGNNSFSRDYAFPFNNKSGELPRTSDLPSMPATLPPVQEVPAKDKNVDMERHSVSSDSSSETADSVRGHDHKKTSHETAGSVGEVVDLVKIENSEDIGTNEVVLDKTPDDHSNEAKIPNGEANNYTSVLYRSVESDMSTHSLTAEGGRTSSSTVESEKQEKSEKHEQQPEKPQQPRSPKTEKSPKQSGKSWCFSCSCSPCF
ncbi:hypothetical protein JHK82_035383 [Glycine max]|uniref:Uncharacterized protein n=1 Tax=Glycine max TaxID=3847 RepID=K7LXM3_SOYBN|nr:hypothetical protein JHK85_036106 [Glycine max]KAG5112114.1 hypothetical protein JHK82_035383 [Glycine max]KAG5129399.1 hypothetical protein JHK84_035796 [Glycine max]KAH1100003.1 hypothetical protein GYH30_035249 [Glycine max]KRH18387.1 hypothetical protein GLYMA_13G056300v4 [Glycine max]